jgi:hypothetical protein
MKQATWSTLTTVDTVIYRIYTTHEITRERRADRPLKRSINAARDERGRCENSTSRGSCELIFFKYMMEHNRSPVLLNF